MKKKQRKTYHYNGGVIRENAEGTFSCDLHFRGERFRQRVKSLEKAKAWVNEYAMYLEGSTKPLTVLETEQARAALQALPDGVTLPEAVKYYTERHKTVKLTLDMSEASERYQDARMKSGLRPDSIRTARARVNRLVAIFPELPVSDITVSDLNGVLDDFGVSGQTWNNYRADWSAFFNWCKRQEITSDNPAARIDEHNVDDNMPVFFPVDQVKSWFRALEESEPELVPYYALSFFAGIRTAELRRMTGDLITPELVRVTPATAKTRQMRHIDPPDTLKAWLNAYPPSKGPLVVTNHRNRAARARRSIEGFQWLQNGGRKSFATYNLELTENAARTAFIMGHKDVQLLYSTYRGLTTRKAAESYFAILPGI